MEPLNLIRSRQYQNEMFHKFYKKISRYDEKENP